MDQEVQQKINTWADENRELLIGESLSSVATFACDARHLGNRGNTRCLIWGLCTGPAHGPDEFVDTEVYLTYIEILALPAYRWRG